VDKKRGARGEHVRACALFHSHPCRLALGVSSSQGLPAHNSANFEKETTVTEAASTGPKIKKMQLIHLCEFLAQNNKNVACPCLQRELDVVTFFLENSSVYSLESTALAMD
jgi:hypothetical protein